MFVNRVVLGVSVWIWYFTAFHQQSGDNLAFSTGLAIELTVGGTGLGHWLAVLTKPSHTVLSQFDLHIFS